MLDGKPQPGEAEATRSQDKESAIPERRFDPDATDGIVPPGKIVEGTEAEALNSSEGATQPEQSPLSTMKTAEEIAENRTRDEEIRAREIADQPQVSMKSPAEMVEDQDRNTRIRELKRADQPDVRMKSQEELEAQKSRFAGARATRLLNQLEAPVNMQESHDHPELTAIIGNDSETADSLYPDLHHMASIVKESLSHEASIADRCTRLMRLVESRIDQYHKMTNERTDSDKGRVVKQRNAYVDVWKALRDAGGVGTDRFKGLTDPEAQPTIISQRSVALSDNSEFKPEDFMPHERKIDNSPRVTSSATGSDPKPPTEEEIAQFMK